MSFSLLTHLARFTTLPRLFIDFHLDSKHFLRTSQAIVQGNLFSCYPHKQQLSFVQGISKMRHTLLYSVGLFVVCEQSPRGDGLEHELNTVPAAPGTGKATGAIGSAVLLQLVLALIKKTRVISRVI